MVFFGGENYYIKFNVICPWCTYIHRVGLSNCLCGNGTKITFDNNSGSLPYSAHANTGVKQSVCLSVATKACDIRTHLYLD